MYCYQLRDIYITLNISFNITDFIKTKTMNVKTNLTFIKSASLIIQDPFYY